MRECLGGWREPQVTELTAGLLPAARHPSPSPHPLHSPTPHTAEERQQGDSARSHAGWVGQGTWLCAHWVRVCRPSLGRSLPPPALPNPSLLTCDLKGLP